MNKKKSDKHTADAVTVIQRFNDACNDLARITNEVLFEGFRYNWYWIGEEPGGTCDFGDGDFLSPEEMVLALRSGLTYEQYAEWRDANSDNIQRKGYINLYSWIHGCRHSMLPDKIGNPSLSV